MKSKTIQIVKIFASAIVVGITSMMLYTRGDVHSVHKVLKQQESQVTVLFEERMSVSFLAIKKYFERENPQYRVVLEDEVDKEYIGKIVSGVFYSNNYLELVEIKSEKVINRCVLVYSSKKKEGGQKFLKFLLLGEGVQILKRSGYLVKEE